MYSTSSEVPGVANSGGRYVISRCLPTDGPDPADVTYDGRPRASTSREPSGARTGYPPSMYRGVPSADAAESRVSVQSTAAGPASRCAR